MLEGFQNASRIPELRKRLLFTFAMLAVYRVGVAIPEVARDRQSEGPAALVDPSRPTELPTPDDGGPLARQTAAFCLAVAP